MNGVNASDHRPPISSNDHSPPVADAYPGNWVDNRVPVVWRSYFRLLRLDRPIGAWLLFWPCAWGVGLALQTIASQSERFWEGVVYTAWLALGAWIMRSAGCVWNDILDRDIDARVERTRDRPLASGQLGVGAAITVFLILCVAGLFVLVQFDFNTIVIGSAGLIPLSLYPLAKRFFIWPQLVLGIAFSWGALVGWSSVVDEVRLPAIFGFGAGVFWTLGYDTIYALQDQADDRRIGIHSTAVDLYSHVKVWIAVFYGLSVAFALLAIYVAGGGLFSWIGAGGFSVHLIWQVRLLELKDPRTFLRSFRSNREAGAILFMGLAMSAIYGVFFRI